MASIPGSALDILKSEAWKNKNGGPILCLKDEVGWSLTRVDVKNNNAILRIILTACPSSVPTGYWIADVLLLADRMLKGRFLAPAGTCSDKLSQALMEGGKAKKLIGYLRRMWRRHECSHDVSINELKSLLLREQEVEHASDLQEVEWAPITNGDPSDEEQFFREIDELELDEARIDDDDTFLRDLEDACAESQLIWGPLELPQRLGECAASCVHRGVEPSRPGDMCL